MAEDNGASNQPEMTPEEKKLHDMLQKELIHYSMTFKQTIDDMAIKQMAGTSKLVEQNMTGVIDAILAKNEQTSQAVVDKTIAALKAEMEKQQQAAPRPQPAQQQQIAMTADPNSQGEPQIPQGGQVKPLDYLLFSIGKFLQQTSPKDIIDLVKTLKGGPAVNTMAADQVIQGFKIAKLFNNMEVAKTDIGAFSQMAHEALDSRVSTQTPGA
jgi:hypothetical protein